jgi:single-stranded DNA-binding protein
VLDLNLVILCGRLASAPDLRVSDSGAPELRMLVTVSSDEPRRRIDVLPVTVRNFEEDDLRTLFQPGASLWVTGSVHRRLSHDFGGRTSVLEVVAHQVARHPDDCSAGR